MNLPNDDGKKIAKIEAAINKAFSWDTKVCAPFWQTGVVQFRASDPRIFDAMEIQVGYSTIVAIQHFIANFTTMSVSMDITPYQHEIGQILKNGGIKNAESLPIIAWPLIVFGLHQYGLALTGYVERLPKVSADAPLFIAPLHLWALAEAARAYLLCVDPTNQQPNFRAEAAEIYRITEGENIAITTNFLPYANVYQSD